EQTTSAAAEALRAGNRVVLWGIAAIVVILALAAVLLFLSLPDANAFNARVERIFVENDALTTGDQIKLLEILAQSGTTFSEVLTSCRTVIFVLLFSSTALLVAALVSFVMVVALTRRMHWYRRQGSLFSALLISREQNALVLNDMAFSLTPEAIASLSVRAD